MTDRLDDWTVEATLLSRPGRVVVRARRGHEAPVILKATPPGAGWANRAALRREARLLELVRGEGVVDLLDIIDRRGRTALVLAFVPPGRVVDFDVAVHRLGQAVDRMRGQGRMHTALDADHVLLDEHGHPVVCGFGHVGPLARGGAIDIAAVVTALDSRRR